MNAFDRVYPRTGFNFSLAQTPYSNLFDKVKNQPITYKGGSFAIKHPKLPIRFSSRKKDESESESESEDESMKPSKQQAVVDALAKSSKQAKISKHVTRNQTPSVTSPPSIPEVNQTERQGVQRSAQVSRDGNVNQPQVQPLPPSNLQRAVDPPTHQPGPMGVVQSIQPNLGLPVPHNLYQLPQPIKLQEPPLQPPIQVPPVVQPMVQPMVHSVVQEPVQQPHYGVPQVVPATPLTHDVQMQPHPVGPLEVQMQPHPVGPLDVQMQQQPSQTIDMDKDLRLETLSAQVRQLQDRLNGLPSVEQQLAQLLPGGVLQVSNRPVKRTAPESIPLPKRQKVQGRPPPTTILEERPTMRRTRRPQPVFDPIPRSEKVRTPDYSNIIDPDARKIAEGNVKYAVEKGFPIPIKFENTGKISASRLNAPYWKEATRKLVD